MKPQTNVGLQPDPAEEAAVRAEQVRLLYGSGGFAYVLVIGLVNAHVTAVVLWSLYPAWAVLTWIVLNDLVAGGRLILWHRFRRHSRDSADIERWGRWFTLGITICGGLWGLLASVVFVTDNPAYYVFVVFALGGMTAGAAMREAAHLPAFYGFATPAIVPLSFALVMKGDLLSVAMGLMLMVLALALMPVGRSNNQWIGDNIRLRMADAKLNDELRQMTAEVADSEQRLKTIFDSVQAGIIVIDPEAHRIVDVNPVAAQLFGAPREAIVGATCHKYVCPADVGKCPITDLGQTVDNSERVLLTASGEPRPILKTVTRVNLNGKAHLLESFIDISDRKRAEEAVARSEEKYRNLVEATTDYIWEVDQNGCYTYVSPAVKPMLGYEPVEIVGKTPFDVMPAAEAKRVAARFGPIAAERRPFSQLENIVLRKDGIEVVLETSGVPIFEKDGAFKGFRGIDRDVTERKRAAAAVQQRDALLHAVAVSATELVTAPSLDEAIARALELVSRTVQVERMTVLESPRRPDGPPILRYAWNAPGLPIALDAEFFESPKLVTPQIAAWQAPLAAGKIVLTHVRTATEDVKKMFERLDIKTLLIVPIQIDGKYWGQIGLDSCESERDWQPFELEILQTLAELIGNAVQREHYVKELANANRIIQDTPTILYRLSGTPSLPVTYVSQNIRLFGYDPAALTVSPHFFMSIIHPDDVAKVHDALMAALQENSRPAVIEYRLLTSQGAYRWVENRYTPIRDAAGRLVEIEGILIDVTERKAAEEKIALLARTDALTGLANRATFIERLRQFFAAARRGAPAFAILYLDVDHFKDVNDTLGHPCGDLMLKVVAERLKGCTREIDLVARPGGDEFAILQAYLGDTADAGALAAKIRAALAVPYELDGNELHITASIGIAPYEPDIVGPDEMLAQADLALYRAKEEGRDQYRFHSVELDQRVRERVAITDELRGALEHGELELYYQPQVELHTGQIVGMEALVRWNHPTRGLLGPSAFIPFAERSGIMKALGQWVLEQACRQMGLWRKAGIAPLTIAVNVSPVQIRAANEFIEVVAQTLAKWNLVPADLELDVTESLLAHATWSQNDVLDRLRELGVKIAIDDFGMQYSSLDYIRTYRISRLKVPRQIVDAATNDRTDGAMMRAIIGIARELGIEVIAQGVETEAQWSFLTATSPKTKVQGFYYSAPVPAERAAQLLQRGRIDPTADQRTPKSAKVSHRELAL